jgi:hypothetical protein
MLHRFIHALLALFIAMAMVLPSGAGAMPMQPGSPAPMMQPHCPGCLHQPSGGPASACLPACRVLACAGVVATLPFPASLPARALVQTAYLLATPRPSAGLSPTPDPLPPRPIALV